MLFHYFSMGRKKNIPHRSFASANARFGRRFICGLLPHAPSYSPPLSPPNAAPSITNVLLPYNIMRTYVIKYIFLCCFQKPKRPRQETDVDNSDQTSPACRSDAEGERHFKQVLILVILANILRISANDSSTTSPCCTRSCGRFSPTYAEINTGVCY